MSVQNKLTPLSTTLFIFALCTSYMFISMQSAKYTYVGDYKFILFKVLIVISTIALGFFTTVFSCAVYAIDVRKIKEFVTNFDFTRNHIVQTFLLYISSIWMSLAIAMLPFGHTVYAVGTGAVDVDRTQQLLAVQQTVYSGPYYIFMILTSIFLFIFFVVAGHTYNTRPWGVDAETPENSMKVIANTLKSAVNARPTFGFYFQLDEKDLQKVRQQQQQQSSGD
jgi:hypothetical protein